MFSFQIRKAGRFLALPIGLKIIAFALDFKARVTLFILYQSNHFFNYALHTIYLAPVISIVKLIKVDNKCIITG